MNRWRVSPGPFVRAIPMSRSSPFRVRLRAASRALSSAGVQAISLDTAARLGEVRASLPSHIVTQGNLDPLVLIAGGEDSTVLSMTFARRPMAFRMCSISATVSCRKRPSRMSSAMLERIRR